MDIGAASEVAATAFKVASPTVNLETAVKPEHGHADSGAGVHEAESGDGKGLVVDISV